ncbi:MAG: hypothetical protein EYC68_18255 [Chloroflexota bacterium]|nr:MAG: hypothetical protein EYC68_18255 [Chloroflexota bacterium]
MLQKEYLLHIRLLGQFDVRANGQRIVIPTRASQSLLAYLVLNAGAAQRREKLAGLFWGETSDELARRYLRNELWRIRKAIQRPPPALRDEKSPTDEFLISDEITITFDANAAYWLDVNALEKSKDEIESLISNLSTYRGELLPGFYDDWVILERERVQAIFENKVGLLLDKLIQEQQWKQVTEWGERWIALGQTPEPAYRALMIASAAQGDSSKLTLAYERCVQAMRDDLGLDPSAETRALYEQLAKETQVSARAATFQLPALQTSGTVTFLFTDIEGSTKLLEALGEEYATLLADQRELLRVNAEKWNGHEIDTQGDAFFFAFFRAADAIGFAADSQRALAAHPFPRGATVRVRMGIHTGEPMLARTGYVGMDVHRAARIGAAGHGGQVLISTSTRELTQNDLPPELHFLDLGEHKLKDLRYPVHIFQLTIEGLPSEFPPLKSLDGKAEPPAPGEPPFKGLDFFDESDAALFFGREALTEKLARAVQNSQFLAVVVGASGSGKSSVVRAGLIPALKTTTDNGQRATEELPTFVLTPTAHPLEALAIALTREQASVIATTTLLDDLQKDPRALYFYLRRQFVDSRLQIADGKTLLVIDQFEELFTLCNDEFEREQFIDNLLYAITQSPNHPSTSSGHAPVPRPPSPVTLILTLRADFYAHLAQYPELRDLVAQHQEYIGPMNSDELRRAIEEPARVGGWEFEPGLVDLMLRDVGDEPGTLPLLSHALLETWKRRSGHTLTVKSYQDAGGVRGAIAHTADSTYEQLNPAQQQIARNIFLRLTRLGEGTEDTRRRATMEELIPRAEDAAQVRAVVTTLADARLITTSEQGVEVAHEALIREWGTLREWLNQDRDGLRVHRHLTDAAHEWQLLERDAGALYRGAHLAQARDWAQANPDALNEQERAFLKASEENEEREARERAEQQQRELLAAQNLAETQSRAAKQLRRRAVFLAGALLVALVLASLALFLSNQARQSAVAAQENERTAIARELAASALNSLDSNPEQSILLAMQAVTTTYSINQTTTKEAVEALHRVVQNSRLRLTLHPNTGNNGSVAFSPDGKRLATGGENGQVKLWDVTSGKELFSIPAHEKAIWSVAFSPAGTRLATGATMEL